MTHINQRRDFVGAWISDNPVLMAGEVGWEVETRKSKLGDGVTHWVDLPYTSAGISATKADVGLSEVNNTSDLDKPISTATQTALNTKANAATSAPLASPAFTGNPTAPTPPTADNDTSLATTAYVKAQEAASATLSNKTIQDGIFLAGLLSQKPLIVCVSTGRPGHSVGQVIYEADTDRFLYSNGAAWKDLTDEGGKGGGVVDNTGGWSGVAPPNSTSGTPFVIERAGTFLLTASNSGWASAGTAYTYSQYIDGVLAKSKSQFFNVTSTHLQSPLIAWEATLTAGTHYWWTKFTGSSDANDPGCLTWTRI